MDIQNYWHAVLKQHAKEMEAFFHKEAYVNWHNTNEHFTVHEFIKVTAPVLGLYNYK